MKNLLIYTNNLKRFSTENELLVKVQIDNSLDFGWKPKDILLFTNFPYSFSGIKAQIVPDDLDLFWDRTSNKIFVIEYLLKNKLLSKGLYWYHDFDAYENEKVVESRLELDKCRVGLTGYGYKDQINGGSFFFRDTATELFTYWAERLQRIGRTRADEKTMTDMVRDGTMDKYPHKVLNLAYNFGQRGPELCYEQVSKPLKVLHFHPHYTYYGSKIENIDIFMHGKNQWKRPMMSDRLIKVFKKHGIE